MSDKSIKPETNQVVKHTSGPWSAVKPSKGSLVFEIRGARQRRVALVWYHDNDPIDQTPANARLIAAAPDLLEACKLLLGLQERAVKGGFILPKLVISIAYQAIAKAEGK